MTNLKEVEDNLSTAHRWARTLQDWVSTSFPKFALVLSLVGLILFAAEYIYLSYLLEKHDEQTQTQIENVNLISKKLEYQTAIGSVRSCLESAGGNPKLHTWYCSQAVQQYRNASENRPQARVEQVIDRRAYRGMREDLKGYVRGLELHRLSNTSPSGAAATLATLLSKTVVAAWLFFVLSVLTGSYLFLWVVPHRRRAR